MQLTAFNAAPRDEAIATASVWAEIPRWVEAIVDARPYAGLDALEADAAERAAGWTRADLDRALAQHPRIGARPVGEGAAADASRREQAAMSDAPDDVALEMAAGNAAYEERFGRVFLIRAAGRTAPEMLAELRRRLRNDDDTEAGEAIVQLGQIALLRIRSTFEEN